MVLGTIVNQNKKKGIKNIDGSKWSAVSLPIRTNKKREKTFTVEYGLRHDRQLEKQKEGEY